MNKAPFSSWWVSTIFTTMDTRSRRPIHGGLIYRFDYQIYSDGEDMNRDNTFDYGT